MEKKIRVVYPGYHVDNYNWDRVRNILIPLSKLVDLTVYYFEDQPRPTENFCKFVAVPRPDMRLYSAGVLDVVKNLPDFDLLYCWSGGAYDQLLHVLTAQLAKVPIVMHINGDAHLSRRKHIGVDFTWAMKFLQDAVDRMTLNNIDCIVPISSNLQKVIMSRVKNINRVSNPLPFTVDTDQFKPHKFPNSIIAGYAGRISPEKGFPFLTNVMNSTQRNFRMCGPVQMRIVMPQNCRYDGLLSLQFMYAFYAACSLITLPSHGEGIPGMILESYACGRPVIVTPEALPPEIPCFGWSVDRNVQSWKSTLESITQDEIEQKGKLARDWILEHWLSWDEFANELVNRFLTVIG